MFDIHFSNAGGFQIDFPFVHIWFNAPSVYIFLITVLGLRLRKIILDRKAK